MMTGAVLGYLCLLSSVEVRPVASAVSLRGSNVKAILRALCSRESLMDLRQPWARSVLACQGCAQWARSWPVGPGRRLRHCKTIMP